MDAIRNCGQTGRELVDAVHAMANDVRITLGNEKPKEKSGYEHILAHGHVFLMCHSGDWTNGIAQVRRDYAPHRSHEFGGSRHDACDEVRRLTNPIRVDLGLHPEGPNQTR